MRTNILLTRKAIKAVRRDINKRNRLMNQIGAHYFYERIPFGEMPVFKNPNDNLQLKMGWRCCWAFNQGFKAAMDKKGREKNTYSPETGARLTRENRQFGKHWLEGHEAGSAVVKQFEV